MEFFYEWKLLRPNTVKPPIKDSLKEDKPPNKGQVKSILLYTHFMEQRTKRLVPKVSLLRGSTVKARVHNTRERVFNLQHSLQKMYLESHALRI